MTDVTNDQPLTVADVVDSSVADFQAVIDTATAANAGLYAQKSSLEDQIKALRTQLTTVTAQIAAAEGPEVKKARAAQQMIGMIKNGVSIPALGLVF